MIKNLTTEKIIHLILVILVYALYTTLVILPRNFDENTLKILQYYMVISSLLIIFYSHIFWLFPKYAQKRKVYLYVLLSILIISVFFLINSSITTINLQEPIFKKEHIQKSFFETYILRSSTNIFWLQWVAVVIFGALIYSFLKVLFQMIVSKGLIKARTLIICIVLIISAVSLFYIGRFFYYKSFEGNEKIIFISNSGEIKTIENLIELKEFKGNILYIDIWGTYCGPCMKEFQHGKELKELKERYKNKAVKFIYLADGDPNDLSKWKRIIAKYELQGYHMLMSDKLYKNLMSIKGLSESKPLYILIDKNGNIANPNAKNPSYKEKL
jgi:thiol-disulfide isomerase/thioredoxin